MTKLTDKQKSYKDYLNSVPISKRTTPYKFYQYKDCYIDFFVKINLEDTSYERDILSHTDIDNIISDIRNHY